ncbi:MAG TPA: Sir2 family NAD-dependent protein deacetylase, partial [Solirubrobacterales bacterium]|nr:Sir2 family NAD-dependent protein deacetylase [Solirubrobacterales bacterium]
PNAAHRALAELESRGMLDAVITQNIDMLHLKAGSERVIEVHGSIRTATCQECRTEFGIEQVDELFDEDGVAICSGCGGHVKPDVVLFGELLPAEAITEAEALAHSADLMLCIGSSLEVHPVAGLPSVTLGRGGRLAVITQGPTPFDPDATVRMDGDVVADLEAVLAALAAFK